MPTNVVDDPEEDRPEVLPEVKLNLSLGVFPGKAGYIVVAFKGTGAKVVYEGIEYEVYTSPVF